MKLACDSGSLLRRALDLAHSIEEVDMSIPREWVKRDERVMVNRPLPEYASMRLPIFGPVELGGRMWSRMYEVKLDRMELLFWKKVPALFTNFQSSMYSTEVPFMSAV